MKNKLKKICICVSMSICTMLPNNIRATDFAGNEDYYNQLCFSQGLSSDERQICMEFKEYYRNQTGDMQNQISGIQGEIDAIKASMDSTAATIQEQQLIIDKYAARITENNAIIENIKKEIAVLETQMAETQKNIDVRDKLIKSRMLSEQANVGTNTYMDFVMGASDLMDLIRIVEGLERITASDQDQITALEEDKAKLAVEKDDQVRLETDQEDKRKENEQAKQSAEVAQATQEDLLAAFHQQEAELTEQKRSVLLDISSLQEKIDSISVGGSSNWAQPVGGFVSAGTWSYGDGSPHLGLDFAGPIGSPIVSPFNGVVFYANNPVSTNSHGWIGFPAGGGNTVLVVGEVNGTTYAVSFAHMAQENFSSSSGMNVTQGQQLGVRGNSGNSTGPHTHIEVHNLGTIGIDAAYARFRSSGGDFSFGTGWSYTGLSTTCAARGGATPCRERPELFFN